MAPCAHCVNDKKRNEPPLATHSPPDLRRLWGRGELTDEQVIGHLIQHLLLIYERLDAIEKRLPPQEAARPEPRKPYR